MRVPDEDSTAIEERVPGRGTIVGRDDAEVLKKRCAESSMRNDVELVTLGNEDLHRAADASAHFEREIEHRIQQRNVG
jgi:hypothetical protein